MKAFTVVECEARQIEMQIRNHSAHSWMPRPMARTFCVNLIQNILQREVQLVQHLAHMASLSSTPREAYPDRAKRHISETVQSEQPRKKAKVLLEEDDSSEQEQHGTYTPGRNHIDVNKTSSDHQSFTINEDFARRFEHNKRREELQKRKSRFLLP